MPDSTYDRHRISCSISRNVFNHRKPAYKRPGEVNLEGVQRNDSNATTLSLSRFVATFQVFVLWVKIFQPLILRGHGLPRLGAVSVRQAYVLSVSQTWPR